jgi:hypothetical protein
MPAENKDEQQIKKVLGIAPTTIMKTVWAINATFYATCPEHSIVDMFVAGLGFLYFLLEFHRPTKKMDAWDWMIVGITLFVTLGSVVAKFGRG